MTKVRGICSSMVLCQVHVEIGGTSGLCRIMTERSGTAEGSRQSQDGLAAVVHDLTQREGPFLPTTQFVLGIGVNRSCRTPQGVVGGL